MPLIGTLCMGKRAAHPTKLDIIRSNCVALGVLIRILFDCNLQDGFVDLSAAYQWGVSNLREEDDE